MSNDLVAARIQRFDAVIRHIKKRNPALKTQADIANAMNYSRGGTISDYKNPQKYSEEKFITFVKLLSKVFHVNEEYILSGKGEMFMIEKKSAAESSIPLSEQQQILRSVRATLEKLALQLSMLEDTIIAREKRMKGKARAYRAKKKKGERDRD